MAIKSNYFKTRVVRYPALVVATLAATLMLGLDFGLSKADWATWVGSVGTVGTLIGTIWLATSEARRRRHDEIARANIVAASLAPRISLLRSELEGMEYGLDFVDEISGIRGTPRAEAVLFLTSSFKVATSDELLILTGLADGSANQLAYAQSQMAIFRMLIENHIQHYDDGKTPLDDQTASEWKGWMRGLRYRFQSVEQKFVAIARVHARIPNAEDIYSP